MLAPVDTLHHLKARLRETVGGLGPVRGEGFLSLVLEFPELPTLVPQLAGPQFHFVHGHRDELHLGYGVAAEWRASGPERLSVLRAHARRMSASWSHLDPDETGFGGFAFLGFAARPLDSQGSSRGELPNSLLWLPEIALRARRGQGALVLTTKLPAAPAELLGRWTALLERLVPALSRPAPGPLHRAPLKRRLDAPDARGWPPLVQAALEQIAANEFQKVVLARRLRIEGSRHFDLARLLAALSFFFPSCQIVNVRRGETSFVAATPERLLALRGNRVEVDALAGTASRSAEAERDGALARALRCSRKNLHEHQLVVQAVCDALTQCASMIEAPPGPQLMQLNNAQHLWTRIGARLDAPTDVFALAELLHPTPATNGQPRCKASTWLQQTEPFERGWYTGAAGIIEPNLSGELWVLLRCAALRDHTAELYAGAGIVRGSDPSREWRETEHKLAAMLTALQFA